MTLKKESKLLNDNRIKLFRYLLLDDKINDLLITKHIEVKDFVKNFLVLLFQSFIVEINSHSKDIQSFNLSKSFLEKNFLEKKDIFYILKVLKNSIHFFLHAKKIENYLLSKSINEVFDFYFEALFEKEEKEEEHFNDNFLLNNLNSLINENLSFLQIDKNSKLLKTSILIDEQFNDIFKLNEEFSNYLENEKIKDEFLKNLKSKKTWEEELKIIKNNKVNWFFIKIVPSYDENRELEFYYVLLKDITLEKNLDTQKKLFLEQSKMAAMGELISMIAHQWRQPLQTISILAQKLILTKISNGHVDNEILEKSVADMELQISYMSKTIDDFRNFFKPENEKKICNLEMIIDKTMKFLHYVLTINNIDIRIEIVNNCEISVIENNIIQVLINLIKNSKDAILEKNPKDKFVIIRADFNENYAIIEVEDSAGGIAEENIDKIFESYFTTKNNENGTGLGLYMSKTIIEEHCHGKLNVKNSENGAMFTISLPLK